ncbi:GvpL/GvpF family gas vesicle protein [Brachybacterium endophyticum]|nr:GvpL/GvpF family gas vesicle protein [Brachybacterium endophyticum]
MSEAADLYVYAVVGDGDYRPTATGIDGAPLQVVDAPSGLRAVVHEHTAGPYEGPDDDVKRWILEHSDAVDDAWQQCGAVLPVSFNVIVHGDQEAGSTPAQQLADWLETNTSLLGPRLEHLEGTTELRVEISLDRAKHVAEDPEVLSLTAEMESRPAGVRRLLSKRLEKMEKDLADRAADGLYPDLRTRLAQHCVDIEEYRRAARDPGLVPVLTAACLVRTAQTEGVGAELTSIQQEHPSLSIRFLGPWPPYSFADMTATEGSMTA